MPSPPQEAEQIRGQNLTPESPKPVHYPSPSNIPLLEKDMDPKFHESALGAGNPSYSSLPHQNPPTAQSSHSYYTQPQSAPAYTNAQAGGASSNGQEEYGRAMGYAGGYAPSSQDTSTMHSFAHQQPAAASYSDAAPTPKHEDRPSYPISYDTTSRSPYPGADPQSRPAQGYAEHPYERLPMNNGSSEGVDFQAILDTLSNPIGNNSSHDGNAATSMPSQASQTQGNAHPTNSALPSAPNLPPRPPPQAKPATHPNYAPEDDIRSYHPHSGKIPSTSHRGQPGLQPLMTANATGARPPIPTYPQPVPLSATQSNHSPSSPGYRRRDSFDRRQEIDILDDEDARWPPEINKKYEAFLDEERKFVTDGQWDQFPMGSRLFIGNLPTEKVTKRDIFHRFHRHGKLAQISIKQAYGFVQFLDAPSCQRALQSEQGQVIRGRKMHLEISKPQRNTRKADDGGNHNRGAGARRRSRSPDYTRGGTGSQGGRGVDRYTSQQNGSSPRDRDFRRGRDDYRPGRSPSPPRGGRGRGGRDRSRDRYDGRRRSRSRSPWDFGPRGPFSPIPKKEVDEDDELPLPRRARHEVPDVQVLVVDDLDQNFIKWVEDSFKSNGLTCDVLLLSPRLSEAAVIYRQLLEGVLAVSILDRESQKTSRIRLRVFDRSRGDKVLWNNYEDLEPFMASQLVIAIKKTTSMPNIAQPPAQYGMPPPTYGLPQSGYPQMHQPPNQGPPPPASNTNLSSLISSLDTSGLQQLLGAIGQPNASKPQPSPTGLSPDLMRLLSASAAPPQQHAYGQQSQSRPDQNQFAALASNPALANNAALMAMLGGQAPPPPPPPQQQAQPQPQTQAAPGPDMNQIMAQLAKYRR